MEDELIPPAFLANKDIFVTFVNNNYSIFLKKNGNEILSEL